MDRYQVYSEYKPIDVEWLGQLPSHWMLSRIKFASRLNPPKSEIRSLPGHTEVTFLPMEAIGEDGSLDTTRTKNLVDVLEGYSYVTDGDVMIAKITPCFENGKGAIAERLRNGLGFATTEVIVVRPDDHADSRFLYYVLSAEPFRSIAEGSMYGAGGQKRVADSFVANYSTGWPSSNEREQIAAFLDHETAKIDRLIDRQERLIELLKEKRQAVISNAVSSSDTSELVKLGYFVDLLPGYAFPSASFSHDDSDMPLLRGINVGVDSIRWDETVYWPKDSCIQLRNFSLKSGDLVFGMDRPWISGGVRVAEISHADVPALLLQRVCRLRARRGLTQKFLKLILSSQEFKDYVEADLTGVSVPHISPDQIGSFRLRLPSEEQQRSVCESADEQFQKIRATISKAKEAICLMKEHRTTLISAAVTGKIDVRGWQMTSTQPQEAATAASA